MRLFDLHCDTLYELYKQNENLHENNLCVSIKKTQGYELYAGCFAICIPEKYGSDGSYEFFKKIFSKFRDEKKNNEEYISICENLTSLNNIGTGTLKKRGIVLAIEGGTLIGEKLDRIQYLHDCGIRMITLTWNGSNSIGDGCLVTDPKGITNFGIKALNKMESLGIIVDISHASEKLFYDVAKISNNPFIASHSNSYAVCKNKRNLTDDQFNTIKSSNGIVGINFCKNFLSEYSQPSLCNVMNHIEHFMSLGGENTVAIGSDFDGTDVPDQLENIKLLPNLYEYLLKHNYSEKIVNDIFFYNAYNFFQGRFS